MAKVSSLMTLMGFNFKMNRWISPVNHRPQGKEALAHMGNNRMSSLEQLIAAHQTHSQQTSMLSHSCIALKQHLVASGLQGL